jgi:hypothetical protein
MPAISKPDHFEPGLAPRTAAQAQTHSALKDQEFPARGLSPGGGTATGLVNDGEFLLQIASRNLYVVEKIARRVKRKIL